MKKKISVVVLLFLVFTSLTAHVQAFDPCTGEKYDGHPALIQECQHNLSVKAGSTDPYPEPDQEPGPYPEPETRQPTPTAGISSATAVPPLPTPQPTQRPRPTEPPEWTPAP